ncbi:hypothetical protein ACFLRB_05805 [Acidobacteriota bacterium]
MKLKGLMFFLLGLGVIFSLSVCKKAGNIYPDNAEGVLASNTGCKNNGAKQSSSAGQAAQPVQECIEYQYNGENTLLVNHINAVFNCCPGSITADTQFSEGVIAIVEREAEHGCKCTCHYDLDYHFYNIPPAVYTIRITCEGGDIREYTVNLASTLSGSKCWDSPLQGQ